MSSDDDDTSSLDSPNPYFDAWVRKQRPPPQPRGDNIIVGEEASTSSSAAATLLNKNTERVDAITTTASRKSNQDHVAPDSSSCSSANSTNSYNPFKYVRKRKFPGSCMKGESSSDNVRGTGMAKAKIATSTTASRETAVDDCKKQQEDLLDSDSENDETMQKLKKIKSGNYPSLKKYRLSDCSDDSGIEDDPEKDVTSLKDGEQVGSLITCEDLLLSSDDDSSNSKYPANLQGSCIQLSANNTNIKILEQLEQSRKASDALMKSRPSVLGDSDDDLNSTFETNSEEKYTCLNSSSSIGKKEFFHNRASQPEYLETPSSFTTSDISTMHMKPYNDEIHNQDLSTPRSSPQSTTISSYDAAFGPSNKAISTSTKSTGTANADKTHEAGTIRRFVTRIKGGDPSKTTTYYISSKDKFDKLINEHKKKYGYTSWKRVLLEFNEESLDKNSTPNDHPNLTDFCLLEFIDEAGKQKQLAEIIPSSAKSKLRFDPSHGPVISIKIRINGHDNSIKTYPLGKKSQFSILMNAFCVEKKVQSSDCSFMFDGELLSSTSTPACEDLEGGEIIDVKMKDVQKGTSSKLVSQPKTVKIIAEQKNQAIMPQSVAKETKVTIYTRRNKTGVKKKKFQVSPYQTFLTLVDAYMTYYGPKGCNVVEFYVQENPVLEVSKTFSELGIGDGTILDTVENVQSNPNKSL